MTLVAAAFASPCAAQETPASIRTRTASEALQYLLDRNLDPPGPLGGDGATIAGVLAGQSLTFPIASSSGAFVTRDLEGFGPRIRVATSGSFGSLFAERGLTNGRRNLSIGLNYQRKAWRSLSGVNLRDFDLTTRAVFRNDVPERGPAGTIEDFAADISFSTDVVVLAGNYGLTSDLDIGVSVPFVRADVSGEKRLQRQVPHHETVTLITQQVSGRSEGLGDLMLRLKYRLPLRDRVVGRWLARTVSIAAGYDARFPTGRTAELSLDCRRPPCSGGATQEVPDLGLGKTTHKWTALTSAEFGRFSPHVNLSFMRVPSFECDERRFGNDGECRGSIFELDMTNGVQDAKNQNLANEWNLTAGIDYQLIPYKATLAFDVIGRQLLRAGRFYEGRAHAIIRGDGTLNDSVSTELESRHGNVNTAVGVGGLRVGVGRRWVASGTVLFPLNDQGLQPGASFVVGLERAVGLAR